MANIWFTSDLHLCHDREFVWETRGFNSVDEMNQAIVDRFNSVIQPEDTSIVITYTEEEYRKVFNIIETGS